MAVPELSIAELNEMEPYEFEYFVADVWRRQGYDAQVSQQSADGGIDIVADNGHERVAIQVKRYSSDNPVGVKTVREIAGISNHPEYDRVAIATSSDFTRSAYKEANRFDVRLYPGEELLTMHDRPSVSHSDSPKSRGGASSILTSVLTLPFALVSLLIRTDPQRIIDLIVNVIVLFLLLVVLYTVIDSVATNMFDFPLPWGI